MALFKVSRGNSTSLPHQMTDGCAYFCKDTGEFFIDYKDSNGVLCRKPIVDSTKSQVILNQENLSTLKIYQLTQEEYNQKVQNGDLEEGVLYLTPDEENEIDLSMYATIEQLADKADKIHNHDEYYTIQSIDAKIDEVNHNINNKADIEHTHDDYATTNHNHDGAYASTNHTHDDKYYTETEVDTKISEVNAHTDNVVSQKTQVQLIASDLVEALSTLKIHKTTQSQYEQDLANGNIDETALYLTPCEDVDLSMYVTIEQLSDKADINHDHDDKYYTIQAIDEKIYDINAELKNKADADHTHGGEYYTKNEIDEQIGDINNNISDKADVGHTHDEYYTIAEINTKIDAINNSIKDKASADHTHDGVYANIDHNHNDIYSVVGHTHDNEYYTEYEIDLKIDETKAYADGIKNELLNGAGDAYDTLQELGALIDVNVDAIDALEIVATGKADKIHYHAITDVSGLQSALGSKAEVSHNHDSDYDAFGSAALALKDAKSYVDLISAQKSQVQIITLDEND